jgi:hypothetical protein
MHSLVSSIFNTSKTKGIGVLKIRDEQMKVFAADALLRFEERMVDYLCGNFGRFATELSDEERADTVRTGVAAAKRYQTESEYDIRRFLEYWVTYGGDMDANGECAWIGETLRRSDLDGGQKMDLLDELELNAIRSQLCPD